MMFKWYDSDKRTETYIFENGDIKNRKMKR